MHKTILLSTLILASVLLVCFAVPYALGVINIGDELNMGSNKITNLGSGAVSGDAVTWDQLQTAASPWTKKANDDIYYNLGNVGIGTASPGHKLEVDGIMAGEGLKLSPTLGGFTGASLAWPLMISVQGSDSQIHSFQDLFIGAERQIYIDADVTLNLDGEDIDLYAQDDAFLRAWDMLWIESLKPGAINLSGDRIIFKSGGGVEREMVLANTGRVGIGNNNPLSAKLVIGLTGGMPAIDAGNQRIINVADPIGNSDAANKNYVDIQTSSIRWKENIQPIDNALEKVLNLRGVYFDWDEEHGGQHDIGMIAEEVGREFPEVVTYEEGGVYASGMDYRALVPALIEAIKAQQEQIEALRREIEQLTEIMQP